MNVTYYTQDEGVQIVTALKACRKFLWTGHGYGPSNGRSEHICNAILSAMATNLTIWNAGETARGMIMERLGGSKTVVCWLDTRQIINGSDYDRGAVQQYRLRWVNALIKEFSA